MKGYFFGGGLSVYVCARVCGVGEGGCPKAVRKVAGFRTSLHKPQDWASPRRAAAAQQPPPALSAPLPADALCARCMRLRVMFPLLMLPQQLHLPCPCPSQVDGHPAGRRPGAGGGGAPRNLGVGRPRSTASG
jgi:hypothetical protein